MTQDADSAVSRLRDALAAYEVEPLGNMCTQVQRNAWIAKRTDAALALMDLWSPAIIRTVLDALAAAQRERDEAQQYAEALEAHLRTAAARIAEIEADRADDEAGRDMMRDIMSRTAVALRGPEPELTRWGWSDLPERAAAAVAQAGRVALTDEQIDAD
jgi:hypothetical protein